MSFLGRSPACMFGHFVPKSRIVDSVSMLPYLMNPSRKKSARVQLHADGHQHLGRKPKAGALRDLDSPEQSDMRADFPSDRRFA